MNITPLIVGATALVFPVTMLCRSIAADAARKATEKTKEAARQLERSKLPECPIHARGGSIGPGRVDAKWIGNAWVSNVEIARREEAHAEQTHDKRDGNFGFMLIMAAPACLCAPVFGPLAAPVVALGFLSMWIISLFGPKK